MKCKEGECIVGAIAGEDVSFKQWNKRFAKHMENVEEFCSSPRALPHPGHVRLAKFCINCGRAVRLPEEGK